MASHSCRSANSTQFGEIQGSFATQYFMQSNGSFNVSVVWKLAYAVRLAANSGGAGQATASYAVVGAWAKITDVTTSTSQSVGMTSTSYGNNGGHSAHTYRSTITFSKPFTFVAGDKYEVVTGLYIQVDSFVTPGNSSASASVNMATFGDKGTLASIMIA